MRKEPPITTLSQPEGTYTILYGIHIKSQDPSDIPHTADAVILETGMHTYLQDPMQSLERLKHHVQYKALFHFLEERKIPVLFVDLKYRYSDPLLIMADTAFSGIEWMAGLRLLRNKKGRKRNPLAFIAAIWLLMPFVTNILRLGSAFLGRGQKYTGELKKMSHRLHPEADFLYLTLRNMVIAEKEAYLMDRFGGRPHLVTVLGAGHVGIEDAIKKSSEERHEFFRRFLSVIAKVVEKDYFYKAVEYRFDGKKWKVKKIHEVEELKILL